MTQAELFHDNEYDALRATVEALGGAKRVASQLWPSKPMAEAQKQLLRCLDSERPEKLALDELFHIWRMARERNVHILTEYVGYSMHYEIKPISPEQRKAEAVDRLAVLMAEARALAKQLEEIK
jgi:hypothetical protein